MKKRVSLLILFFILGILLVGCCGLTGNSSLVKTESQNTLSPEYIVTQGPDEILLEREDLAERWNEVDSWGDYEHDVIFPEVRNHGDENASIASLQIKAGVGETVSINVVTTNTIQRAQEEFPEKLKGERLKDRISVGNEMLTSEYEFSGMGMSVWKYTIVFRRNNVVVTLVVNDALGLPSDSEKEQHIRELEQYAISLDERIS